jgi:predicted nucleic acid-binding protein
MNEVTLVFVDSNVVIDITSRDPKWEAWSARQIETFAGRLAINPVIYAELCFPLPSAEDADDLIAYLGLKYREFSRESLFLAAQAYRIYRQRGGTKTSPLPDFFIGAHAAALGVPIITRDVARYQTYFPGVTLISPPIHH